MIDFADPAARERLREALNRHEGFAGETAWFDGSILLDCDGARCWLKVYRGRVLEALGAVPPFGYTFKLSGTRETWEELVGSPRQLADLLTPGQRRFAGDVSLAAADSAAPARLPVEGNLFEASRLHEALFQLADCLASLARAR